MRLVKDYSNGVDFYNFLVFHKRRVHANRRASFDNGEYICVVFSEVIKLD